MQDRAQNPTTNSQEWKKDNLCVALKICAEWCVSGRLGGAGNSVQIIGNQLERTRLDHHNMQISDYRGRP